MYIGLEGTPALDARVNGVLESVMCNNLSGVIYIYMILHDARNEFHLLDCIYDISGTVRAQGPENHLIFVEWKGSWCGVG